MVFLVCALICQHWLAGNMTVLPEGTFLNVRYNPNTGDTCKTFVFIKNLVLGINPALGETLRLLMLSPIHLSGCQVLHQLFVLHQICHLLSSCKHFILFFCLSNQIVYTSLEISHAPIGRLYCTPLDEGGFERNLGAGLSSQCTYFQI